MVTQIRNQARRSESCVEIIGYGKQVEQRDVHVSLQLLGMVSKWNSGMCMFPYSYRSVDKNLATAQKLFDFRSCADEGMLVGT